jgi:hypothetical protein
MNGNYINHILFSFFNNQGNRTGIGGMVTPLLGSSESCLDPLGSGYACKSFGRRLQRRHIHIHKVLEVAHKDQEDQNLENQCPESNPEPHL